MRILIHAPAARMGGAHSHLLGLCAALARIAPDDPRILDGASLGGWGAGPAPQNKKPSPSLGRGQGGGDNQFLLVAHPDVLAELPALPTSWQIMPERPEDRGQTGGSGAPPSPAGRRLLGGRRLLARLAWEQRRLPALARSWSADVLLSFGSFVPLRCPCPTVLEAGNALPFTRTYWQLLESEPLSIRAAEVARWVLLQRSLRSAARVLAPTHAMRGAVLARLPDLAGRVEVVPWGVSQTFHDATWVGTDEPRLLAVSKHGINKEFDVLVAALPSLIRRWPAVRVLMTGTEDESRWSRRSATLARTLDVAEHVTFLGDVPNRQLPALLASASLLVFPTWCESFGLPLAEALAMGAPAIAADIPACREVGADAARYYRPGDPEDLARTAAELLADPAATRRLATRAREHGRQFDWSRNALGTLEVLARAAGRS